jgi:hypothetical protein
MRPGWLVGLLLIGSAGSQAADGIWVRSGPDATVFGNCVPSLVVENRSSETIDYLQVDLVLILADGQERTLELQSAYHEGILYPIAPGANGVLKQHLDTSRALGVSCDRVTARKAGHVVCESAGGAPCKMVVSVSP